jgi:hypothetical protein
MVDDENGMSIMASFSFLFGGTKIVGNSRQKVSKKAMPSSSVNKKQLFSVGRKNERERFLWMVRMYD